MRRSSRSNSDLFSDCLPANERVAATRTLLAIVAAGGLLIVVFFGGEYLQRYFRYGLERSNLPEPRPVGLLMPFRDMALNTVYEIPMPWRSERLLDTGLAVYDLRIGTKSLDKLHDVAELVTAREISSGVQRDYVPADFWIDDSWLPIEIRLRGFTSYHYLKNHPSLRLKFPKHRFLRGRRVVNLVEPYDKELTTDLATNWFMARQGLLTLDGQFVVLRINGKVIGLFQEIEHFGPSIADRNRRPEGFIFSGEGELFGKPSAAFPKAERAMALVTSCQPALGGDPPPHCTHWSFIRDYFDTDRMAWAAALTALLKSRHGWAPVNLRLFWDPARGKFEPIPWDYLFFPLDRVADSDGEADYSGYLMDPFLRVPEFRRMRDERLWRLLTHGADQMVDYANRAFEKLRPALRHDVRHLSLDVDVQRHEDYVRRLLDNRAFLEELFRTHDLRARTFGHQNAEGLEISNFGKSPVEVTAVVVATAGTLTRVPFEEPVVVDGSWQGTPGRSVVHLPQPLRARPVSLVARNGLTGDELAEESISFDDSELPLPVLVDVTDADPEPLTVALGNVSVEGARATFGPGRVVITDTLEIPSSHEVVFAPGLHLLLGEGASLLVYGDLFAVGTQRMPIRVSGLGGTMAWGGLIVQGTRSRPSLVEIEHVVIEGGTGGQSARTLFTAPFAVHDGLVIIESSEFRHSATDDGINLKNSVVHVESNRFVGASGDAVDCDFCVGDFIANTVIDSSGDALDFSGSEVVLKNNRITRCGDKGMSIGERTRAVIEGNHVQGCITGVAVKDLSEASIGSNRFSNLQVGVAAYIKKLTFGASYTSVEGLTMDDTATRFLREDDCLIAAIGL